jgi:hypothetical protein
MHCGNRMKFRGANLPHENEVLGLEKRSRGRNLLKLLKLSLVRPVPRDRGWNCPCGDEPGPLIALGRLAPLVSRRCHMSLANEFLNNVFHPPLV